VRRTGFAAFYSTVSGDVWFGGRNIETWGLLYLASAVSGERRSRALPFRSFITVMRWSRSAAWDW
jgi:hypothetical protein